MDFGRPIILGKSIAATGHGWGGTGSNREGETNQGLLITSEVEARMCKYN